MRNRPLILIADDQPMLRQMLRDVLASEGYEFIEASTGHQAIDLFRQHLPDIVLLDVIMPGIDGPNACAALRNLPEGHTVPILMITGRDDDQTINIAFAAGADDYITKPFNPRELTIRARNLLQRTMAEKEHHTHHSHVDRYQFNGWTLDLNSRSLINPEGELIKLPRSEFRALLHFCENPGKIQTREDLLMTGRELKPHDRTVDVTIRRIRKHFEDHPNTPEIIVTIHGEGYRFCGTFE